MQRRKTKLLRSQNVPDDNQIVTTLNNGTEMMTDQPLVVELNDNISKILAKKYEGPTGEKVINRKPYKSQLVKKKFKTSQRGNREVLKAFDEPRNTSYEPPELV